MKKKYAFTKERKKLPNGAVVRRIKALRNFGCVKKGKPGGWIESEENLSHDGNCWVYDDAYVSGNARVSSNAQVYSEARVYGNASVYGNAYVCGEARVYGEAEICGKATVYDNVCIFGNAYVCGEAVICGKAVICGEAKIRGEVEICGNTVVKSMSDYMVFKNTWSSGRWFTYTSSNKMWKVGCFYGTGKELIAKAKKDSKLSGKCYELIVKTTEALEKAKLSEKGS